MKLTYTVELDFGDDADIASDHMSGALMQRAFAKVGTDVAGQTLRYLTIWPHDDATPDEFEIVGYDRVPIPPDTCPTCGIQRFEKAAA